MVREQAPRKWEVPEDEAYAQLLTQSDLWRGPAVAKAIQALQLPKGSRGLDAGCGIGQHTILLARSVGPDGHATGVDLSLAFVARGKRLAKDAGVSDQTCFRVADLNQLPFDDDRFDWLWSADTVAFGPTDQGYVADAPGALIQELARVVKPGGLLTLAYCAAQNLLPGYPLLEAMLNAASAQAESFVQSQQPELHRLRALDWLRDGGLVELSSETTAHTVQAPLDAGVRQALAGLLQWRWGSDPESALSEERAEQYRRLCVESSPEFILDLPGYSSFFTCSTYTGVVAE